MQQALEYGIRAFDTSPYYGPSEEILGAALDTPFVRANVPREQYFLLTKVGRIAGDEFDYSPAKGDKQLKRKTGFIANDLTKLGQYHVGVLKKPTGPGGIDVTKQGYQTPGIHEGVVYGGVFIEDSSSGCVSVQKGVKGRTTR